VGECYSYRQFCSLGPLPPRTPARPDPQVPRDRKLGPCLHGKIGSFYFYEKGSDNDAALGFFDVELSVQSIATGRVRVELYCVADGYQTSRGIGAGHPIRLAIMAGGDAKVIDGIGDVFAAMGRVTHIGPVGTGQMTKLANQIIVGATMVGVAEALHFATKGGADPAAVRSCESPTDKHSTGSRSSHLP